MHRADAPEGEDARRCRRRARRRSRTTVKKQLVHAARDRAAARTALRLRRMQVATAGCHGSTMVVARMELWASWSGIGITAGPSDAGAGSGNAAVSKARSPRRTRAFPDYVASLVGAPVEPGDDYRCCATATRCFRRCSTPSGRRSIASASRASSTKTAWSAINSPPSSSVAAGRGRHRPRRARRDRRRALATSRSRS